jgi:hypothetical protein
MDQEELDHETIEVAEQAFIEGFRSASDKLGFLKLARIPLELQIGGGPGLKLMEVAIEEVTEVGRASPGFASRELVYHPLPKGLVTARSRVSFHYISTRTRRVFTLGALMAEEAEARVGAGRSDVHGLFDGH